jgi:hypothetical protein
MLGRVLCLSDPLDLVRGAVYPPTQEATLSRVLVPMTPNWGLPFASMEGPTLCQGIHLVCYWVIMVWGIWVPVVELLFHIEVVISGSEILLVHLGCILVQRGVVFPCEVVISIPLHFELELPVTVDVLGPSRIHVLLHDIMLYHGLLIRNIPLLSDRDQIRDWLRASRNSVVFHGGKEGDVEYIVNFVCWGNLYSVCKRSQPFKNL